jgi:hypothetical protein
VRTIGIIVSHHACEGDVPAISYGGVVVRAASVTPSPEVTVRTFDVHLASVSVVSAYTRPRPTPLYLTRNISHRTRAKCVASLTFSTRNGPTLVSHRSVFLFAVIAANECVCVLCSRVQHFCD